MFTHPLKNSLHNKNILQRIHVNLDKQGVLNRRIKSFLPADLADHCLHATVSDKKLTLFTNSSMWASKLLYCRNLILSKAASEISQPITSFKVKVMASDRFKTTPAKLKKPSLKTLDDMAQATSSISDEKLKHSLKLLITTLKS